MNQKQNKPKRSMVNYRPKRFPKTESEDRPLYGTEQEKQEWAEKMKRMKQEGTAGDYGVPDIYKKYFTQETQPTQ